MNRKLLLTVFIFSFFTAIFAQNQAPVNVTNSCQSSYGQGTYEYGGMNDGKPYYWVFTSFSGGDCSSLNTLLDCYRDAVYYLIWETDRWYWRRGSGQCQWEEEMEDCAPASVYDDGPGSHNVTYLYSNTADTPEPPTSGWAALPTLPVNYCEPVVNSTLSTSNFSDTSFSIYPNPVGNKSLITIGLGKPFENVKISLYSVLGQLVAENDYQNVSSIAYATSQTKGLYFLKIKVGDQVITKKVILE
jgi:hypothetical protein